MFAVQGRGGNVGSFHSELPYPTGTETTSYAYNIQQHSHTIPTQTVDHGRQPTASTAHHRLISPYHSRSIATTKGISIRVRRSHTELCTFPTSSKNSATERIRMLILYPYTNMYIHTNCFYIHICANCATLGYLKMQCSYDRRD